MAAKLLEISDLRVQYGRFLALDGVSFTLHAGELLGFIGPNGAGKTTTLRSAAGLQPISTGKIRILGHDVFAEPLEAGQHVGFTPDEPQAYPQITVRDYLTFIGKCYQLAPNLIAQRIDHWLEALWLSEKADTKIAALSRGMRQRLAVARTMLPDPSVVLLDEPAAGLDPAGRVQFRRLLASLRDQGKAIIVSSHILADLADYCTHIAIMERGKLRRYGPVSEIAGSTDTRQANYRVLLAHRVADLAARLDKLEDITPVRLDGDEFTISAEAGRDAAARVLTRLVAQQIPVAGFEALRPDLEQFYLESGISQVD